MAVLVVAAALVPAAVGQNNTNVGVVTTRAVGGIMINPSGTLSNATGDQLGELRQVVADALQPVPDAMNRTAGLRKVSLRGIEAEVRKSLGSGKPVPDAIWCLAGLQEIRYVLAYPDKKDIVLVGRGEGWKPDARGNLVGVQSRRPVLFLDDLLTALRAAASPNRAVMSCSINPTPEGMRRVEALSRQRRPGANPQAAARAYEEQLGPQQISITGVPEESHFARVMVAADYRMKRFSLAFEPSPVRGLPTFMDMVRPKTAGSSATPRFWLQPEHQGLIRDDAGLAWELRGSTVRAMAETDFYDAQGIAHPSGQNDPISRKWAKIMTERYDDVAQADPVFGQLRNCMDLAVVAALVVKEDLPGKVGNSFPILMGSELPTAKMPAPKQVGTEASLVHKDRNWIIAAGGVQMNPYAAVERSQLNSDLTKMRGKAASEQPAAWWWD
jgi:hypothetical protein